MTSFEIKVRLFLWPAFLLAVSFFLYMFVVPTGRIVYKYDLNGKNTFIGKIAPSDRLLSDGKTIVGDPVYITLYTPRSFDKAIMTLKYKTLNNSNLAPVVEAGVLVDGQSWRYDLLPVENKLLDKISLSWNEIREGDIVLFQRGSSATSTKKYSTISGFLDDLPDLEEIALYNYDLKREYFIEDYVGASKTKEINIPIRSSYQFYTYIKDEDADFDFYFVDLNRNKDNDDIDILFYCDDEIIDSRHVDDDGVLGDSGEESVVRNIRLKTPSLPEGVYKIEVRVNDDIVTKKIITEQSKIAFINNIWLADGGDNDIELYTNSKVLNVKTINPDSLQTIEFRGRTFELEETYKQFSVEYASTSRKIKLEKDDLIIAGLGVFGFSEEELVDPRFKKIDSNIDIDGDGINYILANYKSPGYDGEWKIVDLEFDLSKAYRENKKYNFIISLPGLKAEDMIGRLEIDEIDFSLNGTGLLKYIKRYYNDKI